MDAGADRGGAEWALSNGCPRPAVTDPSRSPQAYRSRACGDTGAAFQAMTDLRFLTAGESHGKALVALLEGIPAGLPLTEDYIARDLRRRQGGYGRSKRQQLEQDRAELVGGVRHGLTLGGPVAMLIENRVWEDWQEVMREPVIEWCERSMRRGKRATRWEASSRWWRPVCRSDLVRT